MVAGEPFNPWRGALGFYVPDRVGRDRTLRLTDGQKRVFEYLVRRAGRNGNCFPAIATTALDLGKSERQIRDDLKKLRSAGLIDWRNRDGGRNNRYTFLWHEVIERQSTAAQIDADAESGDDLTGAPPPLTEPVFERRGGARDRQDTTSERQDSVPLSGSAPPTNSVHGLQSKNSMHENHAYSASGGERARANATFPEELPTLLPIQLGWGWWDDNVDLRDPLTHLVLSYRSKYNPFDEPALCNFEDELLDDDLQDLVLATWDPDYPRVAAIQEEARCKTALEVDEDTLRALTLDPDDYYPSFHVAIVDAIGGGIDVRSEHWRTIGREALRRGLVKLCAPSMLPKVGAT